MFAVLQRDCTNACCRLIRSYMTVFVLSCCDCTVAETESLSLGDAIDKSTGEENLVEGLWLRLLEGCEIRIVAT
jgi:hypothetical protein